MQGSGFRVQGAGSRVQDSGSRVQGSGFRVQGSGFRVQGLGFTPWPWYVPVVCGTAFTRPLPILDVDLRFGVEGLGLRVEG